MPNQCEHVKIAFFNIDNQSLAVIVLGKEYFAQLILLYFLVGESETMIITIFETFHHGFPLTVVLPEQQVGTIMMIELSLLCIYIETLCFLNKISDLCETFKMCVQFGHQVVHPLAVHTAVQLRIQVQHLTVLFLSELSDRLAKVKRVKHQVLLWRTLEN